MERAEQARRLAEAEAAKAKAEQDRVQAEAQSRTLAYQGPQPVVEVEEGVEAEEEGENGDKVVQEVLRSLKELREDNEKARKEDRERQEKLEYRLDRAERGMTSDHGKRYGDKTNTGGKGQCKEQLKGKCNNPKNCEWTHKEPCIPYRDNGRAGCPNVRLCGKLHPYDCRSVEGGFVCDYKYCKLWHDKWEFKTPGIPINLKGGWDGGQFRQPPKGFDRTPGIKEKMGNNSNAGDGGNATGAQKQGPTLKEQMGKTMETMEKMSESMERIAAQSQAQQSQAQNQWGLQSGQGLQNVLNPWGGSLWGGNLQNQWGGNGNW